MTFKSCSALATHFESFIEKVGDMSFKLGPGGEMTLMGQYCPVKESDFFKRHMRQVFTAKDETLREEEHLSKTNSSSEEELTLVYPTMQFGPAGLRHDEEATSRVILKILEILKS